MADPLLKTEETPKTEVQTSQPTTPVKVGGKEYASWDDVGKAYESLQAEHGKWTQQYGDLERRYREAEGVAKQWGDWWRGIQPLWGDDVEKFLLSKMQNGGRAVQQQPAQTARDLSEAFAGYDTLGPAEQAQRIRDVVAQQLNGALQQQLTSAVQQLNQDLARKEQWYQTYLQNHLGLMRRAFEEKLRNPEFDIEGSMRAAAEAIGGQVDPIQLGQQLMAAASYTQRLEAAQKTAYEQGKKDAEEAFKNKKAEPTQVVSGAPVYRLPQLKQQTNKRGLDSWRESAANAIVQKFGPSWFDRE